MQMVKITKIYENSTSVHSLLLLLRAHSVGHKDAFPFVKTNFFFMLFCTNKGAVMALTGSKGTRLERMEGFLVDVLCSLGNKRPNQLTLWKHTFWYSKNLHLNPQVRQLCLIVPDSMAPVDRSHADEELWDLSCAARTQHTLSSLHT